jgi:arylsulfatase A-like enzyme
MYIRLDKNLERLLTKLDEQVGKGNYTVFLTADHAVAEVPQFMIDNKFPGGYLDNKKIREELNAYLAPYFQSNELVKNISNNQLFFNYEVFDKDPKSAGVQMLVASELIIQHLKKVEGITDVYSQTLINMGDYNEGGMKGMAIRGYHPKRSGDLVIIPESGYFSSSSKTGTTHGTGYSYDTHVPILFYGKGVKKGSSSQYHRITDIAPTVSRILKIQFPSGTTGQPILEILE